MAIKIGEIALIYILILKFFNCGNISFIFVSFLFLLVCNYFYKTGKTHKNPEKSKNK